MKNEEFGRAAALICFADFACVGLSAPSPACASRCAGGSASIPLAWAFNWGKNTAFLGISIYVGWFLIGMGQEKTIALMKRQWLVGVVIIVIRYLNNEFGNDCIFWRFFAVE